MKILSLYIDAFGGLAKRACDLTEGISEILDENGAGKSTLAAFIKAMLYGLDGTATKDPSTNEFVLYRPWSGGRFGGSLTFATEGGTYRIERYFEDKRGANKHLGEYRVIDTATEMPTDAFGEEPGRVLFGVDGESFMRTAYLSSRGIMAAKTGDISAKLGGLDGERWDMASAEDALALIEKRRAEIRTRNKQRHGVKLLDVAERELEATRARITEATAAAEAEARERQSITEAEGRLAERTEKLNALARIKETADRRLGEEKARREQLAELSALLERDKAEVAALSRHFPDAPPSAETLSALDADLGEYNHLTTVAARSTASTDENPPTDEDIATLRVLIKEREDARAALAAQRTDGTAGEAGQAALPFPMLAVILLFLFLPLGIFLLWRHAKQKAAAAQAAEAARHAAEEARAQAEERFADANRRAATALAAVGLAPDASSSDVDALYTRTVGVRLAAAEQKKTAERREMLAERIEGVLSAYHDLPKADAIGVRVDALRAICRRLNERQALLIEHSTALARLNTAVTVTEEPPIDVSEVERLIGLLKGEIATITADIAAARTRASSYRAIADTLDEANDLYETQAAEVERLNARLSVLDKTAAILTEAKDALEARCLGGIRGRISAYTDRLLGKRFGEVRLNSDLALAFSEGGEGHGTEFFSTGLRAIGDICLRLALTDELYPNDPPPLILDDPFMALDEKNLAEAISLLSELADTRQILYLTCHASRSAKG